ncbi:hypothetical protein CsSME_00001540 [Camellia sinensis var. sinensis]
MVFLKRLEFLANQICQIANEKRNDHGSSFAEGEDIVCKEKKNEIFRSPPRNHLPER